MGKTLDPRRFRLLGNISSSTPLAGSCLFGPLRATFSGCCLALGQSTAGCGLCSSVLTTQGEGEQASYQKAPGGRPEMIPLEPKAIMAEEAQRPPASTCNS